MSQSSPNNQKRTRKVKQIFSPELCSTKESNKRKSLLQQPNASLDMSRANPSQQQHNDSQSQPPETPVVQEENQLYCLCRQPYDGSSTMIDCERCNEYYHISCIHLDVNITMDDDLTAFQYICSNCVDELDDKVQELSEKVDELEYSVEKKTSLIDQNDQDVKCLKEKNQIKLENLQKEHATLIKTMKENFSKCDEQRKQNQKDLTKSKAAAQLLSEKLSKAEKDLHGIQLNLSRNSQQLEVVRKTNKANESTITDLQAKISDLENRLKVQKDINTKLIESQANDAPPTVLNQSPPAPDDVLNSNTTSAEDETAASTLPSNPLQECQKKLKIKIKELAQANNLVRHLEDIVGNVRDENTALQDQLDAAQGELDRFRRVNDLLLPPDNDTPELNGLSSHSFLHSSHSEHNHQNGSEGDSSQSEDAHQNGSEDDPVRPQNADSVNRNNSFHSNYNNAQSATICSVEWFHGSGSCDRTCNLNHNINFEKLHRHGFCFHEYFKKDSCNNKQDCKYCHDIPEDARHDTQTRQNVEAKIQRGKTRKNLSTNSTNDRNSPRTSDSQDTYRAPYLMNVSTQYQQMNTTVDNAPHLSSLSNYRQAVPIGNTVPQQNAANFSLSNSSMPPSHNQSSQGDNSFSLPTDRNSQNLTAIPYHFLGQLIQNAVSIELQKMFSTQNNNQV